jgi:hypothetical protein
VGEDTSASKLCCRVRLTPVQAGSALGAGSGVGDVRSRGVEDSGLVWVVPDGGAEQQAAVRGAQVDACLLVELRDRRGPSPGACAISPKIARAIGAEIARAAVSGAAEQRADERGEDRGGRDAEARGVEVVGVMLRNAAECCLAKARGGCPSS